MSNDLHAYSIYIYIYIYMSIDLSVRVCVWSPHCLYVYKTSKTVIAAIAQSRLCKITALRNSQSYDIAKQNRDKKRYQ